MQIGNNWHGKTSMTYCWVKTAGCTTARRAGLCSWAEGCWWHCSVWSPGAGGAAGGSLHRLCPLYVAEPFLEMNVWDFPVENYFTFGKKKEMDKGNPHTHTHRGGHGGGSAQTPLSPESLPWSPELEVTTPHTPYKWELVSRQIFSLVSTYQCRQLNRKFRKGGADCSALSVCRIVSLQHFTHCGVRIFIDRLVSIHDSGTIHRRINGIFSC